MLRKWKERKRKKLRQLNLSEDTWIKMGEIYSHILVNREVSLENEEIVEMSIEIMHKKIVKEGRLNK